MDENKKFSFSLPPEISNFLKDNKIAVLSFFLIWACLLFGLTVPLKSRVTLTNQAADLVNKKLICDPIGGLDYKYDSNSLTVTNYRSEPVQIWIQRNICDYEGFPPSDTYGGSEYGTVTEKSGWKQKDANGNWLDPINRDKKRFYMCDKFANKESDTLVSGQTKAYSIDVPDCKIGQIDINQINGDPLLGGCYSSKKGERWGGGLAFSIKANPNNYPSCPQLTLTPTPSIALVQPSCVGLSFKLQNQPKFIPTSLINGKKVVTVAKGEKLEIVTQVKEFGTVNVSEVKNIGDRYSGSSEIVANRNEGYGVINTNFEQGIGTYVVEVNAFDSNKCQLVCTTGKTLYKDNRIPPSGYAGCRDSSSHWDLTGSCESNACVAWIQIVEKPTLTPTLTPPVIITPTLPVVTPPVEVISIQGRIYEDLDTTSGNIGAVGRAGFGAPIPPSYYDSPINQQDPSYTDHEWQQANPAPLRIDVEINPARPGGIHTLTNIAKGFSQDVCSSTSKDERKDCDATDNCTNLGGFNFVIPPNAAKYNFDGRYYYHLILNTFLTDWVVTEAYFANVNATVTVPPSPVPLPKAYDTGSINIIGNRCDYFTYADQAAGNRTVTGAGCNKCIKNYGTQTSPEIVLMCDTADGNFTNCGTSYLFNNKAEIFIPTDKTGLNNLWIGVQRKWYIVENNGGDGAIFGGSQTQSAPNVGAAPQTTAPSSWWQKWLKYLGM